MLHKNDLKKRNNVAVIGEGVAETLFPQRDPIGQALFLNNQVFAVVGVAKRVDSEGVDGFSNSLAMPITTSMIDGGGLDSLSTRR